MFQIGMNLLILVKLYFINHWGENGGNQFTIELYWFKSNFQVKGSSGIENVS